MFGVTLLLNFVLWAHGSSAALPFLTILALIGLWFGVSVPLTFVRAYFGFRKRVLEHPVSAERGGGADGGQMVYTAGLKGAAICRRLVWKCGSTMSFLCNTTVAVLIDNFIPTSSMGSVIFVYFFITKVVIFNASSFSAVAEQRKISTLPKTRHAT